MSLQITREHLSRLASVEDTRLRNIVYDTARRTGASELSARIASANTRLIRNKLLSATEEEIGGIVESVGEDYVRQLLSQL